MDMGSNTDPSPGLKGAEHLGSSLGAIIFESLKKYSHHILHYIADTSETDTYEQVLKRSIRTALKLREKGIRKGDIISMCTHNHKNSCVPLIAAFFLGAIPANFDPNLSHLDTTHLLKLLRPKLLFVSTESVPLMEKCVAEAKLNTELVVFGDTERYSQFSEYLQPNPEENNFKPIAIKDDNETAIIMFSSGTTGLPKGICLSHRTLVTNAVINNMSLVENDEIRCVSLVFTTFYWISAIAFLIEAVTHGNSEVVCSKFDPYKAWLTIEKYKVTSVFVAPNRANEFLYNCPKDVDVSSLKLYVTGGFPVTEKLMDDLRTALPNATVINVYGQTETGCCISKFDPSIPEEVEMQIKKPLSCGKIRPIFQWKVVDPDTEEILGPYQSGELRVKNDFLMNGYYQMDASSAFDSQGYLKSGDVVYYDDENCLFVVDRIKEMFKYKSWHIVPAVLENVLTSHPAIKEAAVIGIPHEIDGDYATGIVVLFDEYKHITPKEIEKYVEERVPDIQRLRGGVKIINKMIRTATGKIRRKDLKQMVLERKL